MITKAEQNEIREEILQEVLIEREEELIREHRLFDDEAYAFDELVDSGLLEVYETLNKLAVSMNSYGWDVQVQDLVHRLKGV